MRQYPDIVAYDNKNQIVLIVEAKNKQSTSKGWAAKMRRNLYAHNLMPKVPFFLLALPDRFYLWKDSNTNTSEEVEPDEEIDPTFFLKSYYEKAGVSPGNLTGRSFELIVSAWLNQILRANTLRDIEGQNQEWLVKSGLFEALAGGRLELEAVAY